MRGKKLDQSRNKLRPLLWVVMAVCITFTGCMRWGQPLLSRAVIQYDSNVLKSDKELLLLNIVRMHDDQPPHFTTASDIKASFSFSSTGGIGPGSSGWQTDSGGNALYLNLSATTTNSPLITIAPMQGKEFAQRLLKPIDTTFANALLLQAGQQIDKMLRLTGHSFNIVHPDNAEEAFKMIHLKDPKEVVKYPEDFQKELQKRGCFKGKEKDCCLLVNRPRMKPIKLDLDGFTGDIDINSVDIAGKTFKVAEGKEKKTFVLGNDTKLVAPEEDREETKVGIPGEDKKEEDRKKMVEYKVDDPTFFAQLKKMTSVYVEYKKNKEGKLIANTITEDTHPYKLYRQIVLQIKAVQLSGRLQFFPLSFDLPVEGTLRSAKDLSTKDFKDTIDALEKQYRWKDPAKAITGKTREEDVQETKPCPEDVQKTKPDKEKEGFTLTDESGNPVKDTFMVSDDLKGKDMKNIIGALEGQYHWRKERKRESEAGKKEEAFILTKRYTFTVLTDFDYEKMCEQDKIALANRIYKDLELSDYIKFDQGGVIILLRGEKGKNSWPIYGLFRLRNFRQVLQFLAESLNVNDQQHGYEVEYNVAPSQLTEKFLEEVDKYKLKCGRLDNPPLTLEVLSSSRTVLMPLPPLPDRLVDTDYNGKVFWISSPPNQTDACSEPKRWENLYPLRWDRQVFDMVYEIFQMNRIEPPVSPTLTAIPK